jgi:hypothetical protein
MIKKAADECKRLIQGCVSVTRNRLCTGLCIDIGDEEDCNYNVPALLLNLC